MVRRSKRLQEKRIDTDNFQGSRKRKRHWQYCDEPPKKRIKTSHNKILHSNLLRNPLDRKQYANIFSSMQSSSLILMLDIPLVIIREISEYSSGYFKHCYNFNHCQIVIHTLNEHNAIIDNELNELDTEHMDDIFYLDHVRQRAKCIVIKTNYFRYLSDYFCFECVTTEDNGLRQCSVCNTLCIANNTTCNCGHHLMYCKRCVKRCVYCNNRTICNGKDETKCCVSGVECHRMIKCVDCMQKQCSGIKSIQTLKCRLCKKLRCVRCAKQKKCNKCMER
eukprot:19841_1